jgi:hypothetical protein
MRCALFPFPGLSECRSAGAAEFFGPLSSSRRMPYVTSANAAAVLRWGGSGFSARLPWPVYGEHGRDCYRANHQ